MLLVPTLLPLATTGRPANVHTEQAADLLEPLEILVFSNVTQWRVWGRQRAFRGRLRIHAGSPLRGYSDPCRMHIKKCWISGPFHCESIEMATAPVAL